MNILVFILQSLNKLCEANIIIIKNFLLFNYLRLFLLLASKVIPCYFTTIMFMIYFIILER